MTGVYDLKHSIKPSGLGSSHSAAHEELYIPLSSTSIRDDLKRAEDEKDVLPGIKSSGDVDDSVSEQAPEDARYSVHAIIDHKS